MLKAIGERLWNTNPLLLLGLALLVQGGAYLGGYIPASLLPTTVLVMGLAYAQNTTYALQSRAGMRNSNLYHFIAAVAASLAYFWSLQLLVRNDLPLVLLVPYVFATVLATVNGNALSIRIEKTLGIYVEDLKGTPQLMKLWPSVAVLLGLLVWQVRNLAQRGVQVKTHDGMLTLDSGTLVLLIVLGIAGSFSFALLRTARSSDSYWYHTIAFLLNTGIEFTKLAILVKFRLTWELFIPVTTGSVIGALIGANLALNIAKRIQARFDIHVYNKKEMAALEKSGAIPWPTTQIRWLALVLLVQVWAIASGFAVLTVSCLLLVLSAWQQMSFTLKSRSGQRDNPRYLAWASVFSNGVWYITLAPLAMNGITLDKAIPYIIGGAMGSLVGQLVGMWAERWTGALVHEAPVASKPVSATA